MNAKAAIISFGLFLVIFLLVAETTQAKPNAFQAEHYARKRMFLPQREKPEAIRELVERNIPATLIQDNVCFNSKKGPFKIKQEGALAILRVDYKPSLANGDKKELVLSNSADGYVVPEDTTSDNIHFDFRFDSKPYPVTAGQKFYLHEKGGSGQEICVTVYGYYAE
ncbi:PREDICTED: uncharacterized protein LOC107356619 isoform X1 [Acropora digitifera]|uniref:uncharacterized protein LOC107356619 isoform X1 n=1 Tax=Acropora digitifera TaxID=70779 RepID=UPI00077A35A0|nr:PREDICTED: uncharacterized protein LOC107356619 isoform X1 [Acropora digitifera]XP_015778709.1 PREDICTED: uncharacterized protein LOC107356619 isoform X1 [Acropora digitifera]